ncbi:MAG: PEP-CTERM sorting domain-containing protein, partial [Chthoniobacterales bacterium]
HVIGLGSSSTLTTGPLGTGPITFTSFGGALKAVGGAQTITNSIATTSTTTTNFALVGTNDLTLNGTLTYSTLTSAFNMNVSNMGLTTIGGAITGTQAINKNGPGALVFGSATGNSIGGLTTINAGELRVNNTSGNGVGIVTVNDGAILGGSGTVGGALTVNAGGIVRPGATFIGTETLTVSGSSAATFATGSFLSINVSDTAAGRLAMTDGLLTFAGLTTIYLANTGLHPGTYSYQFVNGGTTPIAFNGGAFNASDFAVVHSFGTIGEPVISQVGNTLFVDFTVVIPEPGTMVIGLFGLAACARSFIRRRRSMARGCGGQGS